VTGSLLTLPLRLGLRAARASLHTGRDLADLGLATLEVVERVLGKEPAEADSGVTDLRTADFEDVDVDVSDVDVDVADLEAAERDAERISDRDGKEVAPRRPARTPPRVRPVPPPPPVPVPPAPPVPPPPPEEAFEEPEAHLPDDRELVEEVADPGAEEGAGASLRVAPPFPGYDELRAADVIARLPGVDAAELGATELYERTHRARRTLLEAIAREIRRRPPA
jgi:hypothetical protein